MDPVDFGLSTITKIDSPVEGSKMLSSRGSDGKGEEGEGERGEEHRLLGTF